MAALAITLLRIGLGALLLVAGAIKLHDGPTSVASSIAAYRILAPALVAPLAIALPLFEIFLGLYLVLGLFVRAVALVTALEFVVFALAVASLVIRGLPADCGCFGTAVHTPPSWWHVAADLLLALAALVVARAAPGRFALDRRLGTG
ncbi:MAG: MauE/DoxX family redox-associated membrane protein, partial [Vulcanimicrobiaceae bacterium]